jgi:hypothetical protein
VEVLVRSTVVEALDQPGVAVESEDDVLVQAQLRLSRLTAKYR